VAARRTEIYEALLERFRAIQAVRTVGQRLKAFDDVPETEQPALFVVSADEAPQYQGKGLPTIWRLTYKLFLYARIPDGDPLASGYEVLHSLLTDIEDALRATAEETGAHASAWDTTLGGLCAYARISGAVVKDEGEFGEQAVAVIPIEVLTTAV
jgi:hypothetical protein